MTDGLPDGSEAVPKPTVSVILRCTQAFAKLVCMIALGKTRALLRGLQALLQRASVTTSAGVGDTQALPDTTTSN